MNREEQRQKSTSAKADRKANGQRKQMLQYLGVGVLMFLFGVYVGNVYAVTNQTKGEVSSFREEQLKPSVESTTSEEPMSLKSGQTTPEVKAESKPDQSEMNQTEVKKTEEKQDEVSLEEETETQDEEEQLPTDWNLILVNGTHTLPEDFQVELGDIGSGHKLDVRAVDEFKAMIRDAKKDGATVYAVSSYRTMKKQMDLHTKKIKEYVQAGYTYQDAQKKASTIVAIPGTSEHQLGLAVDLVSAEYKKLDEKQEQTKGFRWLEDNCWKYGFILRYPNGKTDITGIIYEPWHFRYVGKEAALEIYMTGVTLEEYVGAKPVLGESQESTTEN